MFNRKKKELNKTSVSKKNLVGNFGSHNSSVSNVNSLAKLA